MKKLKNSNCDKCREYYDEECVSEKGRCICENCPRNLANCIAVRWCRETESALDA